MYLGIGSYTPSRTIYSMQSSHAEREMCACKAEKVEERAEKHQWHKLKLFTDISLEIKTTQKAWCKWKTACENTEGKNEAPRGFDPCAKNVCGIVPTDFSKCRTFVYLYDSIW